MNNHEIVLGFKNGDEKALKYFFDSRHLAYIDKAYCLTKDSGEAGDIVALAYVKLWEKRTEFTTVGRMCNYLKVCVINASYNVLLHRKRVLKHHEIIYRESESITYIDKTEVKNKDVLEIMEVIGRKLSSREKELFTYETLHNYPTSEIAAAMNITMDTLRVLRFRIEKKIKAMRPQLQELYF